MTLRMISFVHSIFGYSCCYRCRFERHRKWLTSDSCFQADFKCFPRPFCNFPQYSTYLKATKNLTRGSKKNKKYTTFDGSCWALSFSSKHSRSLSLFGSRCRRRTFIIWSIMIMSINIYIMWWITTMGEGKERERERNEKEQKKHRTAVLFYLLS